MVELIGKVVELFTTEDPGWGSASGRYSSRPNSFYIYKGTAEEDKDLIKLESRTVSWEDDLTPYWSREYVYIGKGTVKQLTVKGTPQEFTKEETHYEYGTHKSRFENDLAPLITKDIIRSRIRKGDEKLMEKKIGWSGSVNLHHDTPLTLKFHSFTKRKYRVTVTAEEVRAKITPIGLYPKERSEDGGD